MDFRALGSLVQGSEAQVAFSSLVPVTINDNGDIRKISVIPDWCISITILRFLTMGQSQGTRPAGSRWYTPAQRGTRILAQELAGLRERALN